MERGQAGVELATCRTGSLDVFHKQIVSSDSGK